MRNQGKRPTEKKVAKVVAAKVVVVKAVAAKAVVERRKKRRVEKKALVPKAVVERRKKRRVEKKVLVAKVVAAKAVVERRKKRRVEKKALVPKAVVERRRNKKRVENKALALKGGPPKGVDFLGVGGGLRRDHHKDIWQVSHHMDWFELISENYMSYGGMAQEVLGRLKLDYPLICHGLGLSLGSSEDVPVDYVEFLQELLEWTQAPWFSDHLCISSSFKHQYHDLLPILKTEESLLMVANKVEWVQERFQRPFAVENISYYGESRYHTMTELEFINRLVEKTGCYLLLDINNTYVNARNLGWDAKEFLQKIPHDQVIQIHLAGHWDRGDLLIDTHGEAICDEVWELYEWYLKQAARPISTLIEWDNHLPTFKRLDEEVVKAKTIIAKVFHEAR